MTESHPSPELARPSAEGLTPEGRLAAAIARAAAAHGPYAVERVVAVPLAAGDPGADAYCEVAIGGADGEVAVAQGLLFDEAGRLYLAMTGVLRVPAAAAAGP